MADDTLESEQIAAIATAAKTMADEILANLRAEIPLSAEGEAIVRHLSSAIMQVMYGAALEASETYMRKPWKKP